MASWCKWTLVKATRCWFPDTVVDKTKVLRALTAAVGKATAVAEFITKCNELSLHRVRQCDNSLPSIVYLNILLWLLCELSIVHIDEQNNKMTK